MAIETIRGDTLALKFKRKSTSGDVITSTPHGITFTVKKSFDNLNAVITKRLEDMSMDYDGTWRFTIDPADTQDLDYGKYVYDLEVVIDSEATEVKTISTGEFVLKDEATWRYNR